MGTSTRPPPRPDEAASRRRVERRWLPALGVVAAIVFLTCGARTVGDAIAGPSGPPVDLSGVVRVQPRPGWELEGREDTQEGVHRLLLRRGTAGLFILALEDYGGSPKDLAARYVDEALRSQLSQLAVEEPPEEVVLANGTPALRFGYQGVTDDGVPLEGVVTVVVAPSGDAVVFDGFAVVGDLAWAIDDVRAMVDGAVIA